MDRRLLFALLAALCSLSLNAQQFNAGLKGGLSATQISGDQLSGFDKPGIFAGTFVNLYLNAHTALQMEINFIQKGSKKNPNPDKDDFDEYLLNLNYIEVPLLYRLDFSEQFSVEGGAALAVLLSSKEEGYPLLAATPAFNKQDLSLILGTYFRVTPRLYANLRYSHSVIPVREHSSGASFRLNNGQYNSVLVFGVHYQISRIQ